MKKVFFLFLLWPVQFVNAQNPVVIELFTSQGCSSCPAADKNLTEIIEASEAKGQPVIGLSFHVDYWNYIGWKDPYSRSEFTDRQRKYASIMNLESVYTPQMIVNGRNEFVGSDKGICTEEIARAIKHPMDYRVEIVDIKNQNQQLTISYSLDKSPSIETINVALVERNISNDVKRGENAGKKLSHRNVVRYFYSTKALKQGTFKIELPESISSSSIVIYLQDREWHVIGAAFKNIPSQSTELSQK